jgi:hypothetical protein
MSEEPWGIWASRDAEVALTPKYLLAYLRRPECLVACAYINDGGSYRFRGLSASFWGSGWGAAALSNGAITFRGDIKRTADLVGAVAPPVVTLDYNPFMSLPGLQLVEHIIIVDPYAVPIGSNQDVGRNLILWNLGSSAVGDRLHAECFSIVLNSTRHWCIFENWPTSETMSIYCRCARIAASNSGMMFVQNVKMSINDARGLNQCYMSPDNLAAATSELTLEESKFDPDQCAFISVEGREWATIYWSVGAVTPDQIVLHGCEGKQYINNRPTDRADQERECFGF